MLTLTLAQMRRSVGRLASAGIAIALGAAFVTATLLASGIVTQTAFGAVTAAYAETDLVVVGSEMTDATVGTVASIPGVAVADGARERHLRLNAGGRTSAQLARTVPSDVRLLPQELVRGELPDEGELALPVATAARLGLAVGDAVTLIVDVWSDPDVAASGATDGEWIQSTEEVLVSGVVTDPTGAFAATGGAALMASADAHRWEELASSGEFPRSLVDILVLVEPGHDPIEVRGAILDAVAGDGLDVRTREEHARYITAALAGDANVITALVLGFAAIALIVASLVIANTFAVLVAQRTRQLALLRCVGASSRQLRRSVALEALLVGVGASTVGIAAGVLLGQLALLILNRTVPAVPLPTVVPVTPWVLVVPLIVGTLVTLVAALSPARAASRVPPLAAMRPQQAPSVRAVVGRSRLLLTSALTVGGLSLLGTGMVAAATADVLLGLAVGLIGGLLSMTGVLVGAVLWIPRLVGAAGAILGRVAGPPSELAAANSVRNPRRTATSSSALLIGVTLVAMMSTGAATARASFDGAFDRSFPVDVTVETVALASYALDGSALDTSRVTELRDLPGVELVGAIGAAPIVIHGGGEAVSLGARIVDPAIVTGLVRDRALFDGFVSDTVLVPREIAETVGITDGDPVTLSGDGADGQVEDGTDVAMTARVSDLEGGMAFIAPPAGSVVAPEAPLTSVWVRLTEGSDAVAVAADIQELFADQAATITVAAAERASYESVIDTLLSVVVGLLGIAVVIAVVGVANTLSLSVLERRRETATLRAIGLTRRQLRQTLAVEGMLIAGSGAVLGALLGTLYGWVGARTVLGEIAEAVTPAVPWRDLILVLAVALLAGMAASVLPGRRAARTSPVAALAAE